MVPADLLVSAIKISGEGQIDYGRAAAVEVYGNAAFVMLYRRAFDHDGLICRDICGGRLGAVKEGNYNIDGLVGAKPEVQYGVVLAQITIVASGFADS